MERRNPQPGSSFDEYLAEEGILTHVCRTAVKEVLSEQIADLMKERNINKAKMAKMMGTSRSSLDRLLDPDNHSVTLSTMERAANILGKQLKIEIV